MPAPPARTEISDTFPNPSNAVARGGFGKLYDYVLGLLGNTGNAVEARAALGVVAAGPLFIARTASDQAVTVGTYTKVPVRDDNANCVDTDNCFNNTNNRFTPNMAGYYLISVNVGVTNAAASVSNVQVAVYRNGAIYERVDYPGTTAKASPVELAGTSLVYLNGSSDYVEVFVVVDGTSPIARTGSRMSGYFVRP